MEEKEKYYLAHVTTEKNYNGILSTKGFIPSHHDDNCIQWLGDGVYFWSSNDKDAIKLGRRMVKNKPENKGQTTKSISMKISVNEARHMNLDNTRWEKKFSDYAKELYKEDNILLKILKAYKSQNDLTTEELNEIGRVFGYCVNSFIEVLDKKCKIKVDLVSHYFYHKRRLSLLYSREELCYRQFCVKNLNLINGISPRKWDVK